MELALLSLLAVPAVAAPAAAPSVVLVVVDEPSAAKLGAMPPRKDWAKAIDEIEKGKPAAVVLKAFLDEEAKDRAQDLLLVKTVVKYRNVYAQASGNADGDPRDMVAFQARAIKNPVKAKFSEFTGARLPYSMLAHEAAGFGFVHVKLNPDGAADRWQIVTTVGEELYPSLPLLVWARVRGVDLGAMTLQPRDGGWTLEAGKRRLDLDEEGALPIRFKPAGSSYPTHSFLDVAGGKVPAREFAGKVVIVGVNLPDAPDYGLKTPFADNVSKLDVFADAVSTLLKL